MIHTAVTVVVTHQVLCQSSKSLHKNRLLSDAVLIRSNMRTVAVAASPKSFQRALTFRSLLVPNISSKHFNAPVVTTLLRWGKEPEEFCSSLGTAHLQLPTDRREERRSLKAAWVVLAEETSDWPLVLVRRVRFGRMAIDMT